MRFRVTCEYGQALCDAVDGDDAYEFMELEYGKSNGPYEVEEVPETTESFGFGDMLIHKTPEFQRQSRE